MTVDDLDEREDDEAGLPVDVFANLFSAHGWTHERSGEDEVVAHVDGSWARYELRVIWRDKDRVFQFLAFPDIRVGEDKMAPVHEALSLINEQLWMGHFELWSSNGTVLFRYAAIVDPDSDQPLTAENAGLICDAAIEECERFYPVFQFVLWGGKTPQEAMFAAMIDTAGEA